MTFGKSRASLRALICLLLALVSMVGLIKSDVDFNNPVRSAAEDEITDLPGLTFKPSFKQYSGYLEADDEKPTNRFWHYWFVESKSNPEKDPLVLWLNGGPGCSSLLGLLTELGPFQVTADKTLIENPFAWNKRANIIFMESPAGVGFSYSVNGDILATDDTTAKQNHLALKSFLRKFPKYNNNSLYLTGESYGGVYLPTLGVLVDEDESLNLKGIAIGNGYLDANKLAESLVYFSYYHGLIGRTTWQGLSDNCCAGKPPARGDCSIIGPNISNKCETYVLKATDDIQNSGLNPYNLYDECQGADTSVRQLSSRARNYRSYREHFDRRLMMSAFNLTSTRQKLAKPAKRQFYRVGSSYKVVRDYGGDPPCVDESNSVDYLNKNEVKRALHIPEKLKTPFQTCFDGIDYVMIYPQKIGGLAPQMRKLIGSKRKLQLLVYNGDVDLMCNFFGDEWFVDDLGRKVTNDYQPWMTENGLSGFVKYFEGITFLTVKGSGHMVPSDKPAEALHMFNHFIDGTDY